ncbi:MAG TPA: DUF3179 domain-containing (seleno)protein [Thermoanaerobaculia bacterium]|nr:DUF3179 domain-containing (seleno)protein [Thermoanaerobaculia bacterium]
MSPLSAATALALTLLAAAPPAADLALVEQLLAPEPATRRAAAQRLVAAGDRSLLPAVVDALFFLPRAERAEAFGVLEALAGERRERGYYDWVEYVAAHPELPPHPGYAAFKGSLLARIDRRYPQLLAAGVPPRIRLEEVVSGGVPLEGIPALDRPPHAPAAAAGLRDDEPVLGVAVAGAYRAYPLAVLSWHEMVNDEVGGEPVTLSFCTLCGSAVLYGTRTAEGMLTFGTSGLLYRSNKLMVDRRTLSLWSNLTGEPVVGRLARSGVRLAVLPVTRTTWGAWRALHPQTTAMLPSRALERRFGFDYRPGAADRARAGVRFPVWPRSDALPEREEIFALRLPDGAAKAYPLAPLLAARVLNDAVAGEPVVLVAEPSGAVRAFRRAGHRFAPGSGPGTLRDEAGGVWQVTEEALIPAPTGGAPAEPLPRLPGHLSFWLGWHAFFPHAELWRAPVPTARPNSGSLH